jgi:uncharacterized protein YaiL (DUF2058 family)
VALAVLVSAPAAFAAIPGAKARAVAAKAGASAAKQTHAKSYEVVSCKVTSARRDLCKVRLHYRSGAKTCILDVRVSYKSRTSSTLVYAFGQTVCS